MKSSLARFIPNSINTHAIKRDAWLNDGHLVLSAEQIMRLNQYEQRVIYLIANRLYRKDKLD